MDTTPPTHPQVDPPVLGEHEGHLVYPMPVFARIEAGDPVRTAAFFTSVLDFAVMFTGPEIGGVPMLIHLRRAKYQDILVVPRGTGAVAPMPDPGLVVTFQAEDADAVDALAARVAAVDQALLAGPLDTPWMTRDLTVTDPDGRRWTFTARGRGPIHATVDEAMGEARRALDPA